MAVAKGVQTLSITLATKKELETIATQKNSAALLQEMFVKKFGVETDKAAAMAEDFLTVAKEKGTAAAIK
jgi:hypothetical protein